MESISLLASFSILYEVLCCGLRVEEELRSSKKPFSNKTDLIGKCFENPDIEYYRRFFQRGSSAISRDERTLLQNTYFLNFNYTSLLKSCINEWNHWNEGKTIRIIPIHGSLESKSEIIFGYGDDAHEKYSELEQSGNSQYLQNIKSFYYPSEKYYIDLINIIEQDEFDVFTIGHSLGLSDRVLLKTIFEHDNCKAIRIFSWDKKKEEDHFQKRIALSRHFSDKLQMRMKIVEFDEGDFV